jgi:hypothetical protein
MTPVSQTKLATADGIHPGNCFAAALASLLDLPLWMVPPFEDMFGRTRGDWFERVEVWLERFFTLELVRSDGHQRERLPAFYIASGVSPRGLRHSVIYSNGVLVHDPHPSGAGIAEVEWTWHLKPITRGQA